METKIKNLDEAIKNLENAQLKAIAADAKIKKTELIFKISLEVILLGVMIVSIAQIF